MPARAQVTERCADDLEELPIEVSDTLLNKLAERQENPESGETIGCLKERTCYSLHAGRYRGATWYDRYRGVLWLLAAGVHRGDSPNDFYRVVERLETTRLLYPTERDYRRFDEREALQLRRQEVLELRALRELVLLDPDGPRRHYRGPAGLLAEIWAESVPGLALVALRVRIHREAGEPLGSVDWNMITRVVLGPDATEMPDPERNWQFRYFEEYVPAE